MSKRAIQGMETKKRLIECARQLFHERGYNAVTVDDIIKKAGSSKGGFYTHFNKKEDLLLQMVPLVDHAYQNFLKEDFKDKSTAQKYLCIQIMFFLLWKEIGVEFMSAIYASQIKDLSSERFLISAERKYYSVFETLINEGKEKNEIQKALPTNHIISLFTTCIRGVIYDWCLHKGEFKLGEYGSEIIKMITSQIQVKG